MEKYITKHIKYQQMNNLCPNEHVLKEKPALTNFLYTFNRTVYEQKRQDYAHRLLSEHVHVETAILECPVYLGHDQDLLHDVIGYSIAMQEMFKKSDLVAKTKIQEHWFMRLPIFAACMSLVYALKMYETHAWMPMVIVTLVYVLSIYMVCIRFHQSVSAETKKLCSEIYSVHKDRLYKKVI
jgi:predicted membrane protein